MDALETALTRLIAIGLAAVILLALYSQTVLPLLRRVLLVAIQ